MREDLFKQGLMFFEIFPRETNNDIFGAEIAVNNIGSPFENVEAFKTLDDAVTIAQAARAKIARYVRPENCLFIFSESMKSLDDVLLQHPCFSDYAQPRPSALDHISGKAEQEDKRNNVAVLLFKVAQVEPFKETFGREKEESGDDPYSYQITGDQFQQPVNNLCKRVFHAEQECANRKQKSIMNEQDSKEHE